MKKKLLSILIIAIAIMTFTSCTKGDGPGPNPNPTPIPPVEKPTVPSMSIEPVTTMFYDSVAVIKINTNGQVLKYGETVITNGMFITPKLKVSKWFKFTSSNTIGNETATKEDSVFVKVWSQVQTTLYANGGKYTFKRRSALVTDPNNWSNYLQITTDLLVFVPGGVGTSIKESKAPNGTFTYSLVNNDTQMIFSTWPVADYHQITNSSFILTYIESYQSLSWNVEVLFELVE